MNFVSKEIEDYAIAHSEIESEVLKANRQETYARFDCPQMISGPLQGQFLYFITKLTRSQTILEIGTFTGYAAICMAQALKENHGSKGQLYTLEMSEECLETAKTYFKAAKLEAHITIIKGRAEETVAQVPEALDLVYLDADKEHYVKLFEAVLPKINCGGLLIADNTLWSGKVLEKNPGEPSTRGIIAFNEHIAQDDRVEKVLLPIRDGITLIRKK